MTEPDNDKAKGAQPHEVAADPKLSPEKKGKVLDSLELDARLLDTATAEGMGGGEPSNLKQVLDAKQKVEGDRAERPPTGPDAELP